MGCAVDTITLSIEQWTLAQERIKEAGLAHRVHVHHLDYRNLPLRFEKAFDACISVEMLEVSPSLHLRSGRICRLKSPPPTGSRG